jgi:hypothetical protein
MDTVYKRKKSGGVAVVKKSKKEIEEIKVQPRNLKLDIMVSSRDLPIRVQGNVDEPTKMRLNDALKRGIISDDAYREAMSIEDVLPEDRITVVHDGDLVSGYTITEDGRKIYI